jgi:hypothetical protein
MLVVVLGVWYMNRQRAKVVQALEQAEEGERRNYKIDYSALTVGSLIGAGGFGFVYKGEYLFTLPFPSTWFSQSNFENNNISRS